MAEPALAEAFIAFSTGEWAGWYCDFKADGTRQPVPEQLVPQDMLDWGMAPDGLELLVSERRGEGLTRRTLTIVPGSSS